MQRAEEMADQMYHLALNARSDQVKFQATKDLLDRAGFAPEQKLLTKHGLQLLNHVLHKICWHALIVLEIEDNS